MTAPFGGYKRSGNGREFGDHAFDEFLELKSILTDGPPAERALGLFQPANVHHPSTPWIVSTMGGYGPNVASSWRRRHHPDGSGMATAVKTIEMTLARKRL
jgi:hypothetical protein